MIIVDTSIIVAIVRHEAEAPIFTEILDRSPATLMSAASYVETHMVVSGRRFRAQAKPIEEVMRALAIDIAEVTVDQAEAAISGFLAYGKGRHPAQLNLADCFAYGLAKTRGAPLLFKGDDFSQTDIVAAWRP